MTLSTRRLLAVVALIGISIGACTDSTPSTSPSGPTTAVPDDPGATIPPEPNNSADRLVFWTGPKDLTSMSDSDLDEWKRRGIDGFILIIQHLRGLGGQQDFTGNPSAPLTGPNYDTQRSLRDSKVVDRAKARGMKLYLGFYLVNRSNAATPLVDWFDDPGWTNSALPRIGEVAAAAKLLGFSGLAFDQELYTPTGTSGATWSYTYPGNRRTEADTRAKAASRGQQVMETIVREFPGVELSLYGSMLPENWESFVQKEENGLDNVYQSSLNIDFIDGLSRTRGYRAIRVLDSIFYKTPNVRGATWDTANQYNVNRVYSMFSRRLSDWSYAAPRLYVSPFAWIDGGPTSFDVARPPDYVAEQLTAFRKWGTGNEFAIYSYNGLASFDYRPYLPGMQAASRPARIDAQPPAVVVSPPAAPVNGAVALNGTATDNMGIRSVRWQTDTQSGTAPMTWHVTGGDYRSEWQWEMRWSTPPLPVKQGSNRIVISVEDIKGLVTTSTVEAFAP